MFVPEVFVQKSKITISFFRSVRLTSVRLNSVRPRLFGCYRVEGGGGTASHHCLVAFITNSFELKEYIRNGSQMKECIETSFTNERMHLKRLESYEIVLKNIRE